MIKVVLDANQFVSAVINPKGKPAQIITLVRIKKLELIISQSILGEVRRVLFYPHIKKRHPYDNNQINELLKQWTDFAYFTQDKFTINAIEKDPTDNKYIECAVEGGADYIVSGDKHLKDLKEFQGIKIVNPSDFLKLI